MDQLPLELLEQIFTSACTDGGRTGCALSLVSTYIRAASRISRFHTLSLAPGTPIRVSQLLTCLTKERKTGRNLGRIPKIKHLHLSGSLDVIVTEIQGECISRTTAPGNAHYLADVSTLVALAAPDLETFCFVHCLHSHQDLRALRGVACGVAGFPVLRELTLVGRYPFSDTEREVTTIMPRLERLHLIVPGSGWYVDGMDLLPWAERSPGLTHFRLSNVLQIPDGLGPMLGVDGERVGPPLLSNLKVVVIQTKKKLSLRQSNQRAIHVRIGRALHSHTRHQLKVIQDSATLPLLLEEQEAATQDGDLEGIAETEWLERLQGRAGCWAGELE